MASWTVDAGAIVSGHKLHSQSRHSPVICSNYDQIKQNKEEEDPDDISGMENHVNRRDLFCLFVVVVVLLFLERKESGI